jgi:putative two-component system response regulator
VLSSFAIEESPGSAALEDARIVIIDDERANVVLLERIFEQEGFANLTSFTDPREAQQVCAKQIPDLILLDLHMPSLDGFTLLESLDALIRQEGFLPVLVLTADVTSQAKRRALSAGAMDFLTKPLDAEEVILRSRNLIRTRLLQRLVRSQNRELDERVKIRTRQLEEAQIEILNRLALAAEYRDDETGEHTKRVGNLAADIAAAMRLGDDFVEMIRLAAPLHDLGKVGLPDAILHKAGRLSPQEMNTVKEHAETGARILSGGSSSQLKLAEEIALTHHEHWNGAGYPRGIAETRIPISGRIVAVADVYDALTHKRPYKEAWTIQQTVDEIVNNSGKQFDPDVVAALVKVLTGAGFLPADLAAA